MIVVVATRSKTERAKFELSAKQKVSRWSLKNLFQEDLDAKNA
jgi:hypothetical protein